MQVKPLIYSKQFWIAVAQALLGALAAFSSAYPGLQDVGLLAIAKSMLDIFLRMESTSLISGIIPSPNLEK